MCVIITGIPPNQVHVHVFMVTQGSRNTEYPTELIVMSSKVPQEHRMKSVLYVEKRPD